MRILLVLTEFPPSIGGMQTHALYLVRHLAERGYDTHVVTYRTTGKEERAAACRFDGELGVPVHRSLSRLSYWHNVGVLRRLAIQYKPTLVYCSTVYYGLLRDSVAVPIICRSVGNDVLRPWIAYPYRLGSRLLGAAGVDNWVFNTFKRLDYPEWVEVLFERKRQDLVAQSARRMDVILANSDFTAGLIDRLGVRRPQIEVLVGGVDAERFSPHPGREPALRQALGIAQDAYVITTVCRLVSKKGIDLILDAFPALHRSMPDAHLLIVGDGKHRSRYQKLARERIPPGHVTFAGRVDHLQIQPYYWLSDLFVLASRIDVHPQTGRQDAETMGRVLCEANAAGVPVVAARSGGIPSVIAHGQNGLLFDPDDGQDLLAQIRRVRADRELAQNLVDTGLEIARQQFDWSVILQAHERCFADISAP